MIRRAWAGTLDHVGGLGVFSLFLFGALAAFMLWHGRPGFSALALIMWYVQARMLREKLKRRDEAIETVNDLEEEGVLTPENASRLRRAIRDD